MNQVTMKISLSPLYILTYVLAIMLTTVLSMPAYPNSPPGPVSSDGHINVQFSKSHELIISTRRQVLAPVLISIDVAASILTTVQAYVLLFNNDAISSNFIFLVLSATDCDA